MGSSSGLSVELPSSSMSCSSLQHARGSGGGSDVGAARAEGRRTARNVVHQRRTRRAGAGRRRIPGERVEGPSEHGALFRLALVPVSALFLQADHARLGHLGPQLFPHGCQRVIVFAIVEVCCLVEPVTAVGDLPVAARARAPVSSRALPMHNAQRACTLLPDTARCRARATIGAPSSGDLTLGPRAHGRFPRPAVHAQHAGTGPHTAPRSSGTLPRCMQRRVQRVCATARRRAQDGCNAREQAREVCSLRAATHRGALTKFLVPIKVPRSSPAGGAGGAGAAGGAACVSVSVSCVCMRSAAHAGRADGRPAQARAPGARSARLPATAFPALNPCTLSDSAASSSSATGAPPRRCTVYIA